MKKQDREITSVDLIFYVILAIVISKVINVLPEPGENLYVVFVLNVLMSTGISFIAIVIIGAIRRRYE